MSEIINLSSDAFSKVTSTPGKPVVVDFWAPWCGPCKSLAPILEEVAKDLGDKALITKVNVDDNPAIAGQYGIRAIPTMIIFKDGAAIDTIQGPVSKDALKAKIESHF